MTTLAPSRDRIVTSDVPGFPEIAPIITMSAPRLSRTVRTAAIPGVFSKGLSKNERLILILYYYMEMTMKDIGATLHLSESRVSQMHSSIIDRLRITDLITMPGVRANGRDWLFQALSRLESVAALPPGWDGEGGPPPKQGIVASAASMLQYLQRDDLPLPFICPIAGGTLQIEWSFEGREVELEFLDQQRIAFLRVDNTTTETSMESGEYHVSDINRSRELVDWLVGA